MWVMPSLALALLSPLQETNGHADSELARRLQLLEERVRALEAERDRLALENRSLTEKLAQSDQELVRLAREVIRLNERGRAGSPAGLPPGEEASAVPAERVPTNGTAPEGPIPREGNAPEQDIRGEISYVDRAGGFMVLNRGREHEVRIGYRFEILRDPTGEARRLGIARVSKFMGKTDQLSQLVLVEGRLEEIKEDDIAVAIRKAVEVPDPPGTTSQPAEKKGFRVEGIAGDNAGILLRGVKKEDIHRGQVLAKPGSVTPHTEFTAEVYVLSKEEGGRHTPFFTGYKPQFYLRTTDVTGEVALPQGTEMVMPGDTITFTVKLLVPVALEEKQRFAIREGGKTVGAGVVTKITK